MSVTWSRMKMNQQRIGHLQYRHPKKFSALYDIMQAAVSFQTINDLNNSSQPSLSRIITLSVLADVKILSFSCFSSTTTIKEGFYEYQSQRLPCLSFFSKTFKVKTFILSMRKRFVTTISYLQALLWNGLGEPITHLCGTRVDRIDEKLEERLISSGLLLGDSAYPLRP